MAQIQGTAGSDDIRGTPDSDVIHAGAGDDFVEAWFGDDEVYGEEGNDMLMGSQGDDRLFGGAGNDALFGSLGSDFIDGGDGDDRISAAFAAGEVHGGAGDDDIGANAVAGQVIDGGEGTDILRFSAKSLAAGVTIDLSDPSTQQIVGGTSIVDVERLFFYGSDALDGAGGDHATGGALDDSLQGLSGDDVLNGGGGNDTIDGGNGADQIDGGEGDDVIVWTDGDTIDGGAGIDLIRFLTPFGAGATLDFSNPDAVLAYGSSTITHVERVEFYGDTGGGSAHITGGAYADKLSGYGGDDVLIGGDGNDELYGQGGVDRLEGGGGDDVIVDGADSATQLGFSFIDGGSGFDRLELNLGAYSGAISLDIEAAGGDIVNFEQLRLSVSNGTGTSTIRGGEADDAIFSGYGDDLIEGRGGNDDLRGGAGADRIDGGDGDDLIIGNGGIGPGGADTLNGGEGNDLINADDQVGGRLDGGAGDDNLTGYSGNDTLIGGSGNDVLYGGGGADSMAGGTGDDSYDVDDFADVVTELAGEGVDTVATALGTSAAIYTLPANVENLIGESTAGQTVAGNALDNNIQLLRGNDVVDLSAGGNDTVFGAGGNDYFYFGAAFSAADRVVGGTGTDSVGLLGNYTLTLASTSLSGVENFNLLSGSTLGGTDHFSYSITTVDANVPAGGRLTVYGGGLLAGETLFFNGYAETNGALSVYGGAGDDTFAGGPSNDVFVGGAGADTMYGLGGNDWLEGGAGADTMRGGFGSDRFVYQSASESTASATDHILDFENSQDLINLQGIDANSNAAGDQAFAFIGSNAFSGTAGELRVFQSGSDFFVQGDVNGDGMADLVIQVTTVSGGQPLVATDFML